MLVIYVDDGLVTGCNKDQLDDLITYLKRHFEMKVMNCETYLGLQILRDDKKRTLSLCQSNYMNRILEKYETQECKPVETPEQMGANYEQSPSLPSEFKFKELVGSLLYLATCSRPGISHALRVASQTGRHWTALKRILRYLRGTANLGICYTKSDKNQLVGFSDADYANDSESRKSTTGFCIFFGNGPIAWRSQRQPIVTLSTTEAEYVAGCELTKSLSPIREQLIELKQVDETKPTPVFIDNQSAIKIAVNEGGQARTKHIDVRHKWLTEQVQNKKIDVKHISGEDQPADLLTKPLHKPKFINNRSKLLTQMLLTLGAITICLPTNEGRSLKYTDHVTLKPADFIHVKGDTRYKLTNTFVNPCETFFGYSTTDGTGDTLPKYCFEYYVKKIYNSIPNCKKLATIGPNLTTYQLAHGCNGSYLINIDNGSCLILELSTVKVPREESDRVFTRLFVVNLF